MRINLPIAGEESAHDKAFKQLTPGEQQLILTAGKDGKPRPWYFDNLGFEKPDWWEKVWYYCKLLYMNHGPRLLEVANIEDFFLDKDYGVGLQAHKAALEALRED